MAQRLALPERELPRGLPRWLMDRVWASIEWLATAIARDVAGTRLYSYGVGVTALACAVVAMYLINSPTPYFPYHDSGEYLASAQRIMYGGTWADPQRLPGYPAFLALLFTLIGRVGLMAAEIAQMTFFVLTALEVYILAYWVWRDTRLAAIIAALVGTNIYFLEFVKPILSDGMALWLVTTLALAVALFIERPRAWRLWLVAALTLVLFMTRAEWALVPVPLFAYLLYIAHRHKLTRRLLPHAVLAVALLYAVLLGYVALNARVNGVAQITIDQNINLYGKVIQYGMQDEAPPQYADIASMTRYYVTRRHQRDPWMIYWDDPNLAGKNFSYMGAYARSIIVRHPVEFLSKTVTAAFTSLSNHYQFGGINPQRRMARPLTMLLNFSALTYTLDMLFPICAAWWLLALVVRRRGPSRLRIELMSALILLSLYDLAMTTVASYGEYARLHVGFAPLMLIVVLGSLAHFLSSNRRARPRSARALTSDHARGEGRSQRLSTPEHSAA